MSNSELERLISTWQTVAFIAAICVALGIFLEVVVFFDKKAPLWQRVVRIICAVMVCLGIGFECLSDKKIGSLSDDLQRRADQKMALLNDEANKAAESAADANKRAAEANGRAAEAALELARLDERTAWRELDPNQLHKFLRPVGPQSVDIFVCDSSKEANELAMNLLAGCDSSGWDARLWVVNPEAHCQFPPGILVSTRIGSTALTQSGADALVVGLESQRSRATRTKLLVIKDQQFTESELIYGSVKLQITPGFNNDLQWKERSRAEIRVMIGAKPPLW